MQPMTAKDANRENLTALSFLFGLQKKDILTFTFKKLYFFKKYEDNENIDFTDYVSGIRLSDCSKLVIN